MDALIHCKYLRTKTQLPLENDPNTIIRILHEHPELHVTNGACFLKEELADEEVPADIVSYAYPPRLRIDLDAWNDFEYLQRWKGRGDKECIIKLRLEPSRAEGLTEGMSWTSTALPTTIS